MQVIISMLLLITSVFAQKGGSAEQCDPVEAEKQCFNLLCTNTPKKLIPNDKEDLINAISSYEYSLHPDILKDFDALAALSTSVKGTTKNLLSEGKEKDIADDLLKSPVEGMRHLDYLFEGDLKCIYFDGSCGLIANDLTSYSEEMKTLYKNLSESTYVFREGATLSMKDKRKYLLRALDKLEGTKSKEFMKAEKRKISKLKQEYDYITYSMDAAWLADYVKIVAEENAKFKDALAVSLKQKMSQLIEVDNESDLAKARVTQSCKISSYIKTTLDENVNYEKFEVQKKKIIDNFKTKFLPRLSEKSARELLGILSADPFVLIDQNVNFHPYSPNLSVHRDGYVTPQNNFDVIRDLTLLNQGRTFRCNPKGLLVTDSFNYGTGMISVSKFALANSYGDVMTHELGHWLSAQIKKKNMSWSSRRKLLKVRKCVLKNYPTEQARSPYALQHKNDKFRTEEDFADWFAAKSGVGENGLFCGLKKLTINLGGAGIQNTYLPTAGDPHSNYLFREINIRLNRGETLPQSCKDLTEVYPESAPRKCDI